MTQEISWKRCVKLAVQNNPLLAMAREEIAQAQFDTKISWSQVFPELSLNSAFSRFSYDGLGQNSYSYGVSGKQTLFDGFKAVHDIKSAKLRITALAYNYRVVSSEVRYQLKKAYVELMRTEDEVSLLAEIMQRRQENLKLVEVRYQAGREHLGSLKLSQASLSQAVFDVAKAKRDITVAQESLLSAMGVKSLKKAEKIQVVKDYMLRLDERNKPSFSEISRGNPMIQQMIFLSKASQEDVKATQALFYPSAYLTFEYGRANIQMPIDKKEWNIGLQLTYPFFTGGADWYLLKKKEAQKRRLLAETANMENTVLFTLTSLWANFSNTEQKINVTADLLAASEERAKISRMQYSLGFIKFDNWSIIEDSLVDAKRKMLTAKADVLLAEATWLQAVGSVLENDL
jgi:outer membrane protein TolC